MPKTMTREELDAKLEQLVKEESDALMQFQRAGGAKIALLKIRKEFYLDPPPEPAEGVGDTE